ncbi:hypothetical protein JAAARDRAFT_205936 [Jaapia argillacea MUCL 33604]|uniref:F-box domain-containing protein n=1 Tax=Jaapia argillacea MUCL 33604 TaxID=933084 RepID=A0A067PYK3_9AGAM|nr:hypothetical protein JAAARDRAFT_205936 [Jaapia argillacea MUCL 33604]
MQLSDLGYDIVYHILANFLDHSDFSSIVLLNHSFYQAVMPFLMTSVSLTSPKSLMSFKEFMSSPSSAPWIIHTRSLTVSIFYAPSREERPQLACLLLNVASLIRGATNLEELSSYCLGDLISLQPRVGEALIECRGLLNLHAGKHVCGSTVTVVSRMPCPLRRISLSASGRLPTLRALRPFQSTLQSVSLKFCDFLPPDVRESDVFPQVQHLRVVSCSSFLSIIFALFPNARTLYMNGFRVAKHSAVSKSWTPYWTSLDDVTITGTGFVDLGLSCPIRTLSVQRQESQPDMLAFLRMLSATTPLVLDFKVSLLSVDDVVNLPDFGHYISQTQFLIFTLAGVEIYDDESIAECLRAVFRSLLNASSLVYFKLVLSTSDDEPWLPQSLVTLVADLAKTLPHLRLLHLREDLDKRVWHMSRDSVGGVEAKMLPSGVVIPDCKSAPGMEELRAYMTLMSAAYC